MVRDLETAKAWYSDVFGMSVLFEMPMKLESNLLATGKVGDQTHMAVLSCEGSDNGAIGLLQMEEPEYAISDPIPDQLSLHSSIMVMNSKDIEATFERALKAGSKVQSLPHEFDAKLPDGSTKTLRACSFWDMDGHFYETFEI